MKMGDSIKSSGSIIKLFNMYEDILNDPLALEVQSILLLQFNTRTQDSIILHSFIMFARYKLVLRNQCL